MRARDDRYRRQYEAHELDPGEQLLAGWTAKGGELVLTSRRLLYEPMRTPDAAIFGPIAEWLGHGAAGKVLQAGVDYVDPHRQWALPLAEIAAVEPGDGPQLRVRRNTGEVWTVSVAAGLYSLRPANIVARDTAVTAIRAALNDRALPPAVASQSHSVPPAAAAAVALDEELDLPAWLTPEPAYSVADPQQERWRQVAIRTGAEVEVYREGPVVAYFAGDGMVHMDFNGYRDALPVDASRPPNLVGQWEMTWAGDAEGPVMLDLLAPGILTGAVRYFGGLPPVPLRDSAWWWQHATSTLTLNHRLAPVEGMVLEFRLPARVTVLTDTLLVGSATFEGEVSELHMRRRGAGPFT